MNTLPDGAELLEIPAGAQRFVLPPGVTHLAEPIALGPAHSGLSLEGAPDGSSVLSGAVPLPGLRFRPAGAGAFAADWDAPFLPDALCVGGRDYRMARWPHADPTGARILFDAWTPGEKAGRLPDALDPARTARWAHPEDAVVHAMHEAMWGCLHFRVAGRGADGALALEDLGGNARASAPHPVYRYVENVREELSEPGEWFYDRRERVLFVVPLPGTDLARDPVETVRLASLLRIEGADGAPVRGVRVRGIRFRHAARTFAAPREQMLRSDWTIHRGAALSLRHAEDCLVENCDFERLGGNAAILDGRCVRCAVAGCGFREIGASGVVVAGRMSAVRVPLFDHRSSPAPDEVDATPGPASDDYPRDCEVRDSLFVRLGREEKQCAAVTIDVAARVAVRDCTVAQVPRAGINIGDGCFGGHVVERCDVFDTVLETGDHGAFNSWGRDRFWAPDLAAMDDLMETHPALVRADCTEPSVLRGNRWRCDRGWDVDLGDGSSFYRIEDNVCLAGGIKLREGFRRVVRGNFCANNGLHPHCWLRTGGDVIEGNVFFGPPQPAGRPDHCTPDMARNTLVLEGDEAAHPLPPGDWGVKSPRLRALAPTPALPALRGARDADPAKAERRRTADGTLWRRFVGAVEYSAYGVTPDLNGWVVERDPAAPLREGDIAPTAGPPVLPAALPLEVVRRGRRIRLD